MECESQSVGELYAIVAAGRSIRERKRKKGKMPFDRVGKAHEWPKLVGWDKVALDHRPTAFDGSPCVRPSAAP